MCVCLCVFERKRGRDGGKEGERGREKKRGGERKKEREGGRERYICFLNSVRVLIIYLGVLRQSLTICL